MFGGVRYGPCSDVAAPVSYTVLARFVRSLLCVLGGGGMRHNTITQFYR